MERQMAENVAVSSAVLGREFAAPLDDNEVSRPVQGMWRWARYWPTPLKSRFSMIVLLIVLGKTGQAQDPLQFFKNYFVTGDYAVAGVGLNGQGVDGYASNTITMTGVPCTTGGPGPSTTLDAACAAPGAVPAEPIAAFLLWQSLETSTSPSSANGWFDTWPITGSVVSKPNTLGCWSNGGTNPNGLLRVYAADVLRFLHF